MSKPKSKRALRAQLALLYTIMGVTVVAVVAILVLVLQGYRFNYKNGSVTQGGLVQFDSQPGGAQVSLDGITLANRTASKITTTGGKHTIMMARDGYLPWKKDVIVKPGSILWLTYPRLTPINPTASTATTFASVTQAMPSLDHKRYAVIQTANDPTITLATIEAETPVVTKLPLPPDSYTQPHDPATQSFAIDAWDRDNRRMLVRHVYDDKVEFLSVDSRGEEAPYNISTRLGVEATKVSYAGSSSSTVYILTRNREIRRADLSSATLSGPLVNDVTDMTVGNAIGVTYSTLADAKGMRSIGYISTNNTKPKVLASYALANDAPLLYRVGDYYGERYHLFVHGDQIDTMKGSVPTSDSTGDVRLKNVVTMTAAGTQYAGFAPGGRMVFAVNGTQVATYDLELQQRADIVLPNKSAHEINWMDGFYILSTGATVDLREYDGLNPRQLATGTLDHPAVMSSNGKYIYYFASAESGVALRRVKLTAN